MDNVCYLLVVFLLRFVGFALICLKAKVVEKFQPEGLMWILCYSSVTVVVVFWSLFLHLKV